MPRPDLTGHVDWARRNRDLADAARAVADHEARLRRSESTAHVALAGRTSQARERIRVGGNPWRIVKVQDSVRFSGDRGPWALCESPGQVTSNGHELAWVHATSADADYRNV